MRKLTAPSCLYLWRWSQGGVLRCLQYLREKGKFFHEKKLCYNCEREVQGENHSRSRPCSKCKSRHLTSLWDKISVKGQSESMVFTPYTQVMKIDSYQRSFRWRFKAQHCGHIWTRALAGILHPKKLSLKPSLHERHRIVNINGVKTLHAHIQREKSFPGLPTKQADRKQWGWVGEFHNHKEAYYREVEIKVRTRPRQAVLHDEE